MWLDQAGSLCVAGSVVAYALGSAVQSEAVAYSLGEAQEEVGQPILYATLETAIRLEARIKELENELKALKNGSITSI